eukprot:2823197-Heterocapsa_arctica.AAC.1
MQGQGPGPPGRRPRRMEKAKIVPSTFDIFLGNITTWVTKAEHYCTSNSFPVQVLPEHHLQ